MILKPGKDNGVVLMNEVDYHDAMNQLFSDKTKFKIIKNDPTLTRLKKVQNYSKIYANVMKPLKMKRNR